MILNVANLVLGRAASQAAKKLLEGEDVVVVNTDEAVISGGEKSTLSEYDAWTKVRSLVDPSQGPFHPKRSNDLFRHTVRGMLPMRKDKGKKAFDRLEAHPGVPPKLEEEEKETIPKSNVEQLSTRRFIRLGELSQSLKEGK